jgi:hypothetical protein
MKNSLLLVIIIHSFWSCQSQKKKSVSSTLFQQGISTGVVSKKLEEASGITASIANPGMLWVHNDSGNNAEVYLIDSTGRIQMTCTLAGIRNRDWEDIAIGNGPGADSLKSYVYVADIGDNLAQYPIKMIYRFEEPVFDAPEKVITQIETKYIVLDDGQRDTEALMIDPIHHAMYLLSKREDSVHFYKIDYPFLKDTLVARFRTKLNFQMITAAEISPDGNEVVIKDYENIYYWKRKDHGPISKLLQTPPVSLSYKREPQGEAICFSLNGLGLYTLSESTDGKKAEVIYYQRNK